MDKKLMWKWGVLFALVVWSLYIVLPLNKKVKLGLDLRGGTSYVLEVDTKDIPADARKDARERALEVIRNRVDSMGVSEPVIYPETGNNRIVVQIPGLDADARERTLSNLRRAAFLEFRMVHPKNDELVARMFEQKLVPPGYRVVTVDSPGPGQRGGSFWKEDESLRQGMNADQLKEVVRRFQAPAGHELLLMRETIAEQEFLQPMFVNVRRELTGEALSGASVDYQQVGMPIVNLRFNTAGAKRFAAVTSDYAPGGAKNPDPNGRRYMAVVLDGTLYSAPWIRQPILNGNAVIEGNFTIHEAQNLVIVLRAGALPAPIRLVEERSVDPTLGMESIASGKRAAIVGCLAVVLFMAVYYTFGGMIANLALIWNVILLPLSAMLTAGVFGMLDNTGLASGIGLPTLTLPGIAGLLLTVGMAVDANVLIFERMREEQQQGKRMAAVVSAGYDKALSAILDSNITTVLAAVIMFMVGSGAIRGYAVVLTAGILASMYTAVVVTHMVFDLILKYSKIEKLPMMTWIGETKFDFIGKWRIAVAGSVLVALAGLGYAAVHRSGVLGVEFTSGQSLTVVFEEKVPGAEIESALAKDGIKTPTVQYQRETGDAGQQPVERLRVRVPFADGQKAQQIIESFKGYKVVQTEGVDPQVGREFAKKGIYALLASMLAMIIYISWRFEFAFACGAVVALLHDVIITVAVFCLLGNQLSMTVVAALLTIIGFSINDTIVIFDRIREDLKLMKGRPFVEVANLSINQTLRRTIFTTATTLMTVTALLLLGGGAIHDFALALFIGMIAGTYSTVFIATPVTLIWHRAKKTPSAPAKA